MVPVFIFGRRATFITLLNPLIFRSLSKFSTIFYVALKVRVEKKGTSAQIRLFSVFLLSFPFVSTLFR